MRLVYLTIGFISLGLGIIGIPLPILPTTPFLLLSMACFAKSSKRFEKWLYKTKLYQTYVALSDLCSGLPRDQIDCQRTEEMDPSSDLHSDGHFHLSGTDYLGEACFRSFDDFYHLLSLKSDPQ